MLLSSRRASRKRLETIFAGTYSLSRNSWYSSSPALTGEPPNFKAHSLAPPLFFTIHSEQAYLRDQDAVALLDTHGQAVALLVEGAGADGQDLGLIELLNARLGEEDAAGGLGLGLDALDQNTVEQRGESTDGAN